MGDSEVLVVNDAVDDTDADTDADTVRDDDGERLDVAVIVVDTVCECDVDVLTV